jgi:hypothetical protein
LETAAAAEPAAAPTAAPVAAAATAEPALLGEELLPVEIFTTLLPASDAISSLMLTFFATDEDAEDDATRPPILPASLAVETVINIATTSA